MQVPCLSVVCVHLPNYTFPQESLKNFFFNEKISWEGQIIVGAFKEVGDEK